MDIDIDWLQAQFRDLSISGHIDSGGFKEVYAATHPTAGEIVVKLINPRLAPETVRREILATGQISSSRIPKIIEVGHLDIQGGKCVWIFEERILGETLRSRLSTGPLDAPELLRMGVHILEVLEKAEEVSIVHRDIKPDNIMRSRDGDYFLLDFGLARHLTLPSLTPTINSFGKCTPGYAPPEQFHNLKDDIDSRADIFALGVTLYECATGSNPFRENARDYLETFRRVVTQPLPLLNLSFDTNGQFRDLVASMTQIRRDRRIRTATESLMWLREIVAESGLE